MPRIDVNIARMLQQVCSPSVQLTADLSKPTRRRGATQCHKFANRGGSSWDVRFGGSNGLAGHLAPGGTGLPMARIGQDGRMTTPQCLRTWQQARSNHRSGERLGAASGGERRCCCVAHLILWLHCCRMHLLLGHGNFDNESGARGDCGGERYGRTKMCERSSASARGESIKLVNIAIASAAQWQAPFARSKAHNLVPCWFCVRVERFILRWQEPRRRLHRCNPHQRGGRYGGPTRRAGATGQPPSGNWAATKL